MDMVRNFGGDLVLNRILWCFIYNTDRPINGLPGAISTFKNKIPIFAAWIFSL